MNIQISIIVNAYLGKSFLPVFFETLSKQSFKSFEVIVADNNDREEEKIDLAELDFAFPATYIGIKKNIGYGPTLNYGMAEAAGEYLFVLNTDIIFNDTELLTGLYSFMKEKQEYGAVSPQVFEKGEEIYFPKGALSDIDNLKGCSMFFRRKALESSGFFDPDFIIYAEEDDICLRIKRNGFKIGVAEECSLEHLGGGAVSKLNENERIKILKSYVISNNLIRIKAYSVIHAFIWLFVQFFISIPLQTILFLAGFGKASRKLEDKGPHPLRQYRGSLYAFHQMLCRHIGSAKFKAAFLWLAAKYSSLLKFLRALSKRNTVRLKNDEKYKSLILKIKRINYDN